MSFFSITLCSVFILRCQKLRNVLEHFLLNAFIYYWKEGVHVNRNLFKNLYDKCFSFQLKSSLNSISGIKINLWHFRNCNFYIEKECNWGWQAILLTKYSFSGECYMYQFIPLHSCDNLKKISIKTNVATDEGKAEMKSDTEQTIKLE